MNLLDYFPDADQALDRLVNSSYSTGAQTALMEAHRLLCVAQQHAAADALLRHRDSILARTKTHWEAQEVISKAQGETA